MNTRNLLVFFIGSLSIFFTSSALSKEFTSAHEVTELIELYTSEGCSSCPPADKWLRQLKSDPMLFKKFIPLSFHVDYWNRLGWEDRFSKPQYTNRQYQHHKAGNISQVYTPGLVVNNTEWRNWRISGIFDKPDNLEKVGVLKANYNQNQQQLSISFTPDYILSTTELSLNVAVLGMDLSTNVRLGENSGRILEHDFVVLTHNQEQVSLSNEKTQQWQIAMPTIPDSGQKKNALVVWLSNVKSQHVIQATGGYL